ncbi:uncharacterized protein si:dkey-30e9.6 [Melanotaenia boesemani]|uniref:uncharacterized protein si:dkey-30e9.6 n=1 Tax=Melanotaenia boesemani TaxID=1250792 RepID=UPI001C0538AF|nr:uncharacterized protein si:dkey-30e9.6 [Melanotaenia boesemani]
MKRIKGRFFPNIVHAGTKKKDAPKFITTHRPPDVLKSELMFVKRGKHPPGPYMNPKPPNFRQLDEDLPDMITTRERDPGNWNFKLQHLDTLRTTRSEVDFSSRDTKTRMDTFKPAEPTWDPRLILPPLPWPLKSASYTRHQRRRGAYTAFLNRVEEKLSQSWNMKS